MKHYRLLGILMLLQNYDKMTAKQLADHFEVSVRTIYRDLDTLSEAGYHLVTESGTGGGIWLMNKEQIDTTVMDEEELTKLSQVLSVHKKQGGSSENMALRLRAQMSSQGQAIFDTLSEKTIVDQTDWRGNPIYTHQWLNQLQMQMIKKRKVEIDYEGNRGLTTNRVIHPLGICQKSAMMYLVGYCEKRRNYRVFRLDKIKTLTCLKDMFEAHKDFELETFWNESQRAMKPNNIQKSEMSTELSKMIYPVELEMAGDWFSEFNKNQLREHRYVIDFISESIAFSQIIFRLDQVIVHSPDTLVDRIKWIGKQIQKNYKI